MIITRLAARLTRPLWQLVIFGARGWYDWAQSIAIKLLARDSTFYVQTGVNVFFSSEVGEESIIIYAPCFVSLLLRVMGMTFV